MDDLKTFTKRLGKIFFFLIFFNLATGDAYARSFNFVNNCSFPVWFGLVAGAGSSRPAPANNNYRLEAGGGRNSVTLPANWSGAVAGRTNCAGGVCETADCGGGTGACPRGFNQPATQAEFTVNASGTDFYNLTVINGFNLPVSISPSVASVASNPFHCGAPGQKTPSAGLAGCSWQMTPPLVEYNWVTGGGTACTSSSGCSGGNVCGISMNPGQSPLLRKTCGRLLGYWTANQICGVQRDYGAPFNCSQPLPAPQNNLTWWNLMACVGVGSCYQPGAGSNCCGCVNWDKIGIPVPPGPITQQCRNTNPNWNNGVQPTLAWLKRACPTSYVYPYDDMSSTFTCRSAGGGANTVDYTITFCPGGDTPPPPPQDNGTVRVVPASGTPSQCMTATDTLFVDQGPGQSFTVSAGGSQTVGVGSHAIRLASGTSIPASGGTCQSTLSQTQVQVNKDAVSQVTATYRFQAGPPPGSGFSYNVILGAPFLKVTINGSIPCPGVTGNPICLVSNQAVGTNMTITGQGNHLCSLAIQASGAVRVNSNSVSCFINSTPATSTQPGSISLPSQF